MMGEVLQHRLVESSGPLDGVLKGKGLTRGVPRRRPEPAREGRVGEKLFYSHGPAFGMMWGYQASIHTVSNQIEVAGGGRSDDRFSERHGLQQALGQSLGAGRQENQL